MRRMVDPDSDTKSSQRASNRTASMRRLDEASTLASCRLVYRHIVR